MKQIQCSNCAKKFTKFHLPHQLINCPHLICKKCLITAHSCSLCQAPINLQHHSLASYPKLQLQHIPHHQPPTNQQHHHCESLLSDTNQDSPKSEVQECLLHFKAADLVCLDDHQIICCNCALFGEHKGHEVIDGEGILNKMTNYVQECLFVYEEVKGLEKEVNRETYRQNYMHILELEKEKQKKRVEERFCKLISLIKTAQHKANLKIQAYYEEKAEKIDQSINFSAVEANTEDWYNEIEKLGTFMQSTDNLEELKKCLPYIDNSGRGDLILQQGDNMLQQFLILKQEAQQIYDNEQNTDIITFSSIPLETINNFCLLKSEESKPFPKEQKMPEVNIEPICIEEDKQKSSIKSSVYVDDNLLLSVEHTSVPNRIHHFNNIKTHEISQIEEEKEIEKEKDRIATEVHIENIPTLSISDIKPMTNVSSYPSSDQSRFLLRDKELQDIVNLNTNGMNGIHVGLESQKKKKVGGKLELLPEKFKGIIDDLKNDRAQTIDLTGAELGDAHLYSLCPFIRKAKKLKVLKLIKNKITDDCIPELLVSLQDSKLSSLNLSQNLLTERTCDYVQECSKLNIKTLTLTLNKINRRAAKSKVEWLGKKGVNVVV